VDKNSTSGSPGYVDAGNGNDQLSASSSALALGIKSIPVDSYGVTSLSLRAQARTPSFGAVANPGNPDAGPPRDPTPITWRGAQVKNLIGPDEQSATGLGADVGVLVVTTLDVDGDTRSALPEKLRASDGRGKQPNVFAAALDQPSLRRRFAYEAAMRPSHDVGGPRKREAENECERQAPNPARALVRAGEKTWSQGSSRQFGTQPAGLAGIKTAGPCNRRKVFGVKQQIRYNFATDPTQWRSEKCVHGRSSVV
jgi:hypothetical protein